jgi:hypothetical protein
MSPERRDDDLERRLRAVLHGRAVGLPVEPDAIERIHAGARRRQVRRNATSSLGAVAVIAVAAAGIALRPHTHPAVTTTASQTPTVTRSAEPSPSSVASSAPAIAPSLLASTAPSSPASTLVAPQISGFQPVSFSAVSASHYWVLGYVPCATGACTTIATTTDGKTFSSIGRMSNGSLLPDAGPNRPSASSAVDVRFGDAQDGWLYGYALLQTRDGGNTWSADAKVPGDVVALAAASHRVWAVTQTATSGSDLFQLWGASYASGTIGKWSRVTLPSKLGGVLPDIAINGSTVMILANGTSPSAGGRDHFLISSDAKTFSDLPGPCPTSSLGAKLSNAPGALWASCLADTTASLSYSADAGQSWHDTKVSSFNNALVVGAVSPSRAIAADTNAGLRAVTSGGVVQPVTEPTTEWRGFSFIGFTTSTVGFAIAGASGGPIELWRTDDAGAAWVKVDIGF